MALEARYPTYNELLARFKPEVTPAKTDAMEAARDDYLAIAAMIAITTKPSREQSLALTALEEAKFWTNQALAVHGPLRGEEFTRAVSTFPESVIASTPSNINRARRSDYPAPMPAPTPAEFNDNAVAVETEDEARKRITGRARDMTPLSPDEQRLAEAEIQRLATDPAERITPPPGLTATEWTKLPNHPNPYGPNAIQTPNPYRN